MKNELAMTYKKCQRMAKDGDRPDVIENRVIFREFFRQLVNLNCRFIWIDETSFNPRTIKFYSWIQKDKYDPVYEFPYGQASSAICAMTDQGVNFCQMRVGTNGVREWLMFMLDLEKALENFYEDEWKSMRRRLVFLFDNASINKHEQI